MSYMKLKHAGWGKIVALLLAVFPTVFISCGGGATVAGGGVGGTGMYAGVVSGFGSVFVNGIEFETVGTQITVDKGNATETDLKVGMKVAVTATGNSASTIVFTPEAKGAVTSINTVNNSLVVLGQKVTIDGNTIFEGVAGITSLAVRDNVIVSGFVSSSGSILATYIEKLASAPQSLEVKGVVSNHNSTNRIFTIGTLMVDYSSVQSPPNIVNGAFVEVEGSLSSSTLFANEIELKEYNAADGQSMEIEDVITEVTSQTDFMVDGQRVQTNSGTLFEYGTVNDIALNIRVEVEGTVNADGSLVADKIEFRGLQTGDVSLEGNIEAVNAGNSTVALFGLTVHVDSNTIFKDESLQGLRSFNFTDLHAGDFIEIGGFISSSGDIIAVKLKRSDDPGFGNDEIEGPVDSENPDASLVILGINVDVTGAAFTDANDNNVNASAFFNIIRTGDTVEAKGNFDGVDFIAASAEIEEEN
ncbi:MAG: DUF5666 domain-containing protein [Thermodesulfovibrionia bacterium]|nr:DUF5666 domain-containing protein [Thermodesulfovibrionia bacterium]